MLNCAGFICFASIIKACRPCICKYYVFLVWFLSLLLLQEFSPGLSSAKLPRHGSCCFHCCLCPRRALSLGCVPACHRGKATVNCLSCCKTQAPGCCAGPQVQRCSPTVSPTQTLPAPSRAGLGSRICVSDSLGSQPPPATDPCHRVPPDAKQTASNS